MNQRAGERAVEDDVDPGGARSTDVLLELRGVGRVFGAGGGGEVHALREVDLEIRRGEFVAIVGPSGSGKSTLLHLLGCLDRPTAGIYRFAGSDTARLTDRELSLVRNRRIGFVFQSFHLLGDETALGNVMLPLLYAGVARREARARAEEALAATGLAARVRHRPGELSGGEQQRVAIARALVKRPELMLADEPTGNLDSASGDGVLRLIESSHAQGLTVVLITHDPDVAGRAGRIVRMRDGRVVAFD